MYKPIGILHRLGGGLGDRVHDLQSVWSSPRQTIKMGSVLGNRGIGAIADLTKAIVLLYR